ncbi:MAG: rhodanese-like domain-containing protein [Paracoccaceae bacterium]
MAEDQSVSVDEMTPIEAFEILQQDAHAILVDVRTKAEWAFTGLPDLSGLGRSVIPVEWTTFPTMAPNDQFVVQLQDAAGGDLPGHCLFICRSGARSMSAAQMVAHSAASQGRSIRCSNVAEGFEGDLDGEGHRGRVNGWKVHGLPWRQT